LPSAHIYNAFYVSVIIFYLGRALYDGALRILIIKVNVNGAYTFSRRRRRTSREPKVNSWSFSLQ